MVLYYSGTGNSRHAARILAETLGDELVSLNDRIRDGNKEPLRSEQPLVFVTPTYAWRMPRVVERVLRETEFPGAAGSGASREAYFVLTCGSETGGAARYAAGLCAEKGFVYRGLASVVMPENYVALFEAPTGEQAKKLLWRADRRIRAAAERIGRGEPLPEEKEQHSLGGALRSRVVNPLFYPLFVHASGFHVTEACTGCGLCVRRCPLGNIRLEAGKPLWGRDCTHCMACIGGCPAGAVEYKKHTQGKPRYYLEEKSGGK